jgi:hypothetical protein
MVLPTVTTAACSFLALLLLPFRTRRSMQLEILALRHQRTVYQRAGTKPRLKPSNPPHGYLQNAEKPALAFEYGLHCCHVGLTLLAGEDQCTIT